MNELAAWYKRLPYPAKVISHFGFSLIITVAALYVYDLTVRPDHPYLVGLFPVIACAFVAGVPAGFFSLAITSVYLFFVFGQHPNSIAAILLFVLEGIFVIWLVGQERKAKQDLAGVVSRRDAELSELQRMHDQLRQDSDMRNNTSTELKESNKILLATLENILDRHRKY